MQTTGCPSVSNLIRKRQLASLNKWHVCTLNRITIGSLGCSSDRPVIGGDLVDGLVPAGWGRLILMYSQSTSGSTRPGERPVTARSGYVSSTRQHSIMGHATEEEKCDKTTLTVKQLQSCRLPRHRYQCYLYRYQCKGIRVTWTVSKQTSHHQQEE